ncbi:MAG TPA: hypothetical protein VE959_11690 [Bryobacteraceae bacterium]|nr:hypothetical protein [Bryobacteraceae bacterium]
MTSITRAGSLAAQLKRLGLVRVPSGMSADFALASRSVGLAASWQVERFGAEPSWRRNLLAKAQEKLGEADSGEVQIIKDYLAEVCVCCDAKLEAVIPRSFLAQLEAVAGAQPRDTVEYFANFVRRWGVPEGIGPLDEEAARRGPAVRITTRDGRVRKLESVSGAGNLIPRMTPTAYLGSEDSQPECRFDFSYDEFGNVNCEQASDSAGRLLYACDYGAAVQSVPAVGAAPPPAGSSPPREITARYFLDNSGVTHPRTRSGAAFVKITRNAEGLDERLEYFDGDRRQPNESWSFGHQCETGKLGLPTKVTCLGLNLQPVACRSGYAVARYDYDDSGNLAAQSYFDAAGQPVLHAEGYHKAEFIWNERRNWISVRLFGIAGEPVPALLGFAGWNATYDESGNQTGQSYFDSRGKPAVIKDGFARWQAVYDSRGRMIEQSFFDDQDRPAANRDGVMRWTASFDESGNPLEIVYRDAQNQPQGNASGMALWKARYDNRGRVIEESYFDAGGLPVCNQDGFAGTATSYDEKGNRAETVYLGPAGQPEWCNLGFARQQNRYDYRGRVLEEKFLGPAGEPAENRDGYHRKLYAYDEHGNRTQANFFHAGGKPAYLNGYSVWTGIYDEAGDNLVRQEYRDAAGRLTWHRDGYAVEIRQCDVQGRQVSAAYFGTDRQPVAGAGGYAGWLAKYDARGRVIEKRYLDAQGNLVVSTSGSAAWLAQYDDRGNLLVQRFFTADGRPGPDNRGFAAVAYRYNAQSNRVGETYYDVDGKPVDTGSGVASILSQYDDRGNRISQAFLGAQGETVAHKEQGYASSASTYDARGNEVRLQYFGSGGQPVVNRNGFLEIAKEYDSRNRLILQRKITPDGEEYSTRTEYEPGGGRAETFISPHRRIVSRYDPAGHEIHESWFRMPDGSPEMTRENELAFTRWEASYNELGGLAKKSYFDAQGDKVRELQFEYDGRGNQVVQIVDDLRGAGRERVRTETTAEGPIVRTSLLNKDGALSAGPDGRAMWIERFDPRGSRLEVVYYDAAGNPAPYCGHYRTLAAYDAAGRLARVEYAIPQAESSTLFKPFRFAPGQSPSIVFDSCGADGVMHRQEAFVLRYGMTEGETFRYSMRVQSGEESALAIRMVQRCTGVNAEDGTFEVSVDTLAADADWQSPPTQSFSMTMAHNGTILRTSVEGSPPQTPYPTHPVFVGERWRKEMPFPLVNPFTNQPWIVPLTYTYVLEAVEEIDGQRIAHVHVEIPLTEVGIGSETVVGIQVQGDNVSVADRGILKSSQVATTLTYRFGAEQNEERLRLSVTLEPEPQPAGAPASAP